MTPTNIVVDENRSGLRIGWADGVVCDLSAPALRDLCQSAKSKRLALQGLHTPASYDLRIENVSAIGRYGINIEFSDGHDRGIYPWAMLREHAVSANAEENKNISQPAINCGNAKPDEGTFDSNALTATANRD